jgi:hypothetical protein
VATLTVQTSAVAGTALTANSAAGGGDTFANDGRTLFKAINGDASPTTITFVTTQTIGSADLAVADNDVSVAASADEIIGPFPVATFGSTVSVTYSSVTSLTVDVFKLGV